MTQKPGYIQASNTSPETDTTNAQQANSHSEENAQRAPGYAEKTVAPTLKKQENDPSDADASTVDPFKAAYDTEASLLNGPVEKFGGISTGLLTAAGLLLFLMLLNELLALWQVHWLVGSAASLLMGFVLLGLLRIWRQERRAADEIEQLKEEQQAVQHALQHQDLTALKSALKPWLDRQAKVAPELLSRFKAAAQERSTAQEYWQLYQLMVLRVLDKQAQRIIRHYTLTTSTAVMVIPHAGLDTLVLLWRSRAMTRAIARVYGLETTSLSALRLFKQALITVMVVAGIETLAQEKLLSEGSDELMNRILGGVSQSLLTVRRTYKLGKMIQLACRPYGR